MSFIYFQIVRFLNEKIKLQAVYLTLMMNALSGNDKGKKDFLHIQPSIVFKYIFFCFLQRLFFVFLFFFLVHLARSSGSSSLLLTYTY